MSTTTLASAPPYKNGTTAPRTSAQDEIVSPQRAQMLIHTSSFDIQRKLNADNVLGIANEMRRGRYTTGVSNVAFCVLPDGTRLCVNGQHLLHAIVASDTTQTVNIRYYYVSDLDEARRIFCRFDNGRGRSEKDAFIAFELASEISLNQTQLGRLSSAVRWIECGFVKKPAQRYGREDRVRTIEEWADTARIFFGIIAGTPYEVKTTIESRAVMSVALVTLRHSPGEAVEFWRQVAFDDMLSIDDPRKTLNKFILANGLSGGGARGRSVTPEYFSRATAICWNAYLDNEPRTLIRVLKETAPIHLKNTPYRGE